MADQRRPVEVLAHVGVHEDVRRNQFFAASLSTPQDADVKLMVTV